MNTKQLSLITACLATLLTFQAKADTLVDRGLPTGNLNNAAGANRANVSWAFTQYTPSDYFLYGDSFQNTSSSTWTIDTIRLWSVGTTTDPYLRGGLEGSSIGIISSSYSISDVTYAGGITYQGSSGTFLSTMHQIDFAVGITLAPGETYDFFLDGIGNSTLDYQGNPITVPFVHASNAALSGSPQDGSDNTMLYAYVDSGSIALGDVGTLDSHGYGWDKSSDVNVQVFGSTVPDVGSTMMLFGCALTSLGALRLRIKKA